MGEWHRLHPVTIVKELGTLAWAVVAALAFDFEVPGVVPSGLFDPETAIAVLAFGYAVTRYLFTSYRLTPRTLELRRGVLVKREQTMPRDRIQSVGINTPLLGRLVGVTSVVVSAADTEDVVLSYVTEDAATHLRTLLDPADEGTAAATGGGDDQAPVEVPRERLSRLDPRSLALFAVTETGLVAAGVILVVAIVVVVTVGVLFAPLAVAPAIGIPLFRVASLVGFESWIERERLHVARGILSRHHTTSPLPRIQAVQVSRPLLRRWSGHETVDMSTGDASMGSEQMTLNTVAPFVAIGGWRDIAHRLIGRVELGEPDLRPSSPLTVRRTLVRGGVATGLVAAAAAVPLYLLGVARWVPPAVAVVGVAWSLWYARRRHQVLGWAVDADHVMVRRGVVDRKLSVVPIRKVQDVSVRETFFQRRLGIASVVIDTAGIGLSGHVQAIDLTRSDAYGLADRLATTAARIALPDGV